LTGRKCDLIQVDKAKIQVVKWHLKLIYSFLTSPKFDFNEIDKAVFRMSHGTLKSFPSSWHAQTSSSVRFIKRCYKWSQSPATSFSAS